MGKQQFQNLCRSLDSQAPERPANKVRYEPNAHRAGRLSDWIVHLESDWTCIHRYENAGPLTLHLDCFDGSKGRRTP
jgi:hypothetical protein